MLLESNLDSLLIAIFRCRKISLNFQQISTNTVDFCFPDTLIGLLDSLDGYYEGALVTRQKMIQQYQKIGELAGIGYQHTQLGEAYYHLGDYENAEAQSRQALAVIEDRATPLNRRSRAGSWGMLCWLAKRMKKPVNSSKPVFNLMGISAVRTGLAAHMLVWHEQSMPWGHTIKLGSIPLPHSSCYRNFAISPRCYTHWESRHLC